MDTDTTDKKKMSIREITEEIGRLYENMKSLVEKSQDNGEPMASGEVEQYERMNSRLTDLIKMRDQHYRLLDAAKDAQRSMDRQVETISKTRETGAGRRGDALRKFVGTDEYRNAFGRYLRLGINEISRDEQRALSEGTDADGGYLPATDFLSTLIEKRWENNVYRQIANVIPLGTFETEIAIENTFATATYETEAAAKSESSSTFTNLVLTPRTLRCFTKVSNELLADAPSRGPGFNLETILSRQFGRVMGLEEEKKFGTGDGSAPNPKGLFTYTAASQIADGKTAASKTAITIAELQDFVASLGRQYRGNAAIVMDDSMFWRIRSFLMVSSITSSGGGNYSPFAWSLGDGRLQDGEPDRLLGIPVYCCATGGSPTFGTGARVMCIGDMSYFHIGEREGVSIKVARETYLANNQTGYFAFARHASGVSNYDAFKYFRMAAS